MPDPALLAGLLPLIDKAGPVFGLAADCGGLVAATIFSNLCAAQRKKRAETQCNALE